MKKMVLCFVVVLSLVSNSAIPVLARTFTNEEVRNFTVEDVAELTLEDLENMSLKQLQRISSPRFTNEDISDLSEKFPDFYASLPPEFSFDGWYSFDPKYFEEALGRGNTPNMHFRVYYNDLIQSINAMLIDNIFFVKPYDFFSGLDIDYEYDEDTQFLNVSGKFTHTVGTSYVTLENGSKLEGNFRSVTYSSPFTDEESWTILLHLPLIVRALGLEMKYHAPSTSVLLYSSDYEIPEENQFISDDFR
jgi:hypothetical protein